MYCHGCDGKGWVDSKVIGPTLCPICKGNGHKDRNVQKPTYDQDSIWIDLRNNHPENLHEKLILLSKEMDKQPEKRVLVHLLFDKYITPQGNLIFYHLQNQTITGPKTNQLSRDQIISRGYDVDKDGEVKTWNDVPISPALSGLIDWCRDSKLIHSFEIDANRKGNPCFCDDNMMAMIVTPRGQKTFDVVNDMIDFLYEKHYLKTLNLHLHLLA